MSNIKHVIITDSNTQQLVQHLKLANPLILNFKSGERSKNIKTYQNLYTQMLKNNCDRDTIIYALGGGVVGDIAGFVAATYMRGIKYIQIPTTLLAMVDSSIGGKTGINTPEGKNLIGAFHQPEDIILKIDFLSTLSQKQFINGLVEILKIFATSDTKALSYLNKNINKILSRDKLALNKIIQKSRLLKINIVKKDEKENNLRAVLNFGHTIGHAIEKVMNYKIMHGYAVGLGILVEAKLSEQLNLLSASDYAILKNLLAKLGITSTQLKKLDIQKIIMATKTDKKSKSNQTRCVLLKKIGQVHAAKGQYVHVITDKLINAAFRAACEV